MADQEQRPPRQPLVSSGGIDHHIADLTVTVAADVTLAALQDKLAEHDQWLPIDGDPALSLGTLVEKNSTGPMRLGYGAWRDLLLGLQFHTPAQRLITSGAATMKNVAGYDLTKLMVGQHGLFGKLITLTVRTYKRPAGALLGELEFSAERFRQLLTTPCRPQWALARNGKLFCGYVGDEPTLHFYHQMAEQYGVREVKRHSIEQDTEFRQRHWLGGRPPTLFRASVPPARALDLLTSLNDPLASADPAFGIVVGSCNREQFVSIDRIVQDVRGTVTYDDAAQIRAGLDQSGTSANLLQRLQTAFAE